MVPKPMTPASRPDFIKFESIVPIDAITDLSDALGSREVEVYEKLDGGNCQVRKLNFQLLPGSRSRFLTGKAKIASKPWFPRFTRWAYSNHSLHNLPEDVVLYGEWLGNHTIDYASEAVDKFYVIDLFDTRTNRFVPYSNVPDTLDFWGVKDVEFLRPLASGVVSPAQAMALVHDEPSDFYSGLKEGIVIKDYWAHPQRFWKYLHPDFAEQREERFGGKPAVTYLTPPRIRKAGYRILDETDKDSLNVEDLTREVIRDIQRERGVRYEPDEVASYIADCLARRQLTGLERFLER